MVLTESPNTASGSKSLQRAIQILSLGMQPERSLRTRIKSETVEEPVNRKKPDSRAQSSSFGGRKRKRRSSPKNSDRPANLIKKVKDDDDTAHPIHPLQDYLLHGLDVVFCGINPGRMSAETGHHYANPTNHFWRCLHRSGMTTNLVSPFEDFSLPERFNIGLTNLMDQSSTQASELSQAEMIASVPALLDKLARYRPRFVCFVGVIIWDIVRNSFVKLLQPGASKTTGKGKHTKGKKQMGLQSHKLIWEDANSGLSQETLIFVVPSTSGRVVRYQLPEKITLFTELYRLAKMPGSEVDSSGMERIVWHSDES